MDSEFEKLKNNSRWDKLSEFDPFPNEQTPVAPMQNNVTTPAVETTYQAQARMQQPTQPEPTPPPINYEKQMRTSKTIAIITSILAAVGLCAGVGGVLFAIVNNNKITELSQKNAEQAEIISVVGDAMGTTINTIDDLPTLTPTTGYIYISDWGIKLQIPEGISTVSYILNQNYRPSICFNAKDASLQTLPDFANITKNPGGMGCLTRIAVSEGTADANGNSFGEQVFTSDDFNYFYTLPRVYSTESADQGLENSTAQIIKTMLTKNISAYK